MNKVVNGVASEYEMPMIYENKTTTNKLKNEQIFTVWQDPIIEKLQQENQQLKEEINELELIIGLRQTRKLIHKFDKEYDEEDKRKNPNRDYASIMPDAEEVYKRYYEQQKRINKAIDYMELVLGYLQKDGFKTFGDLDYAQAEVEELYKILKGDNNE